MTRYTRLPPSRVVTYFLTFWTLMLNYKINFNKPSEEVLSILLHNPVYILIKCTRKIIINFGRILHVFGIIDTYLVAWCTLHTHIHLYICIIDYFIKVYIGVCFSFLFLRVFQHVLRFPLSTAYIIYYIYIYI